MSKEHSSLSRYTGKNNVISFIPAHKTGRRIAGLVIVLALVSFAAASGMMSDLAGNPGSAVAATGANPDAGTGFVYFPAQYVNQGTEPTEHIQAF